MKIIWKWTDEDKKSFSHLKKDSEEFDVLLGSFDTEEDICWRISTEIYLLRGIVETNLESVKIHVENWETVSSKIGRTAS